jgi:hypothetical protein
MVANGLMQGTTQSQNNIELTQQIKDAKNHITNLRLDNQGKATNLEAWRKSLDISLGLVHAQLYIDENHNIYLDDEAQLQLAATEVHLQHTTQQICRLEKSMKSKEELEEENVKKEKAKKDGTDIENMLSDVRASMIVKDINDLNSKEIKPGKPGMFKAHDDDKYYVDENDPHCAIKIEGKDTLKSTEQVNLEKKVRENMITECEKEIKNQASTEQSMEEFMSELVAGNVIMSSSTSESNENVYYVDGLLAVHKMKMNDTVLRHMKEFGVVRMYNVMRRMPNGKYELHHAPLENLFKKRKRTMVYNLVIDSIKEIKSYLYHHLKWGDIHSLIKWVTDTYGMDRMADRLRDHFSKFKNLSKQNMLKSFENWHAQAKGYLATDRNLSCGTPAVFVKLSLQEGIENFGNDEIKAAWHESENERIIANNDKKSSECLSAVELESFLDQVKKRYHTYTKLSDNQKRVRRTHQNDRSPQSQNHEKANGEKYDKVCAFHNMIHGCKKKECNYVHRVIMDDDKRAKLLDVASKKSRCNICGISGHQNDSCTKKDEMKKKLRERMKEDKKNIRTTRQTNKNQSNSSTEQQGKNDVWEGDDDE